MNEIQRSQQRQHADANAIENHKNYDDKSHTLSMPNIAAQARRVEDFQHGTETKSRRCLKQPGSTRDSYDFHDRVDFSLPQTRSEFQPLLQIMPVGPNGSGGSVSFQ